MPVGIRVALSRAAFAEAFLGSWGRDGGVRVRFLPCGGGERSCPPQPVLPTVVAQTLVTLFTFPVVQAKAALASAEAGLKAAEEQVASAPPPPEEPKTEEGAEDLTLNPSALTVAQLVVGPWG